MSFNNYHTYQFSYIEKNKREKKSYYVKLSCALHELPTSSDIIYLFTHKNNFII